MSIGWCVYRVSVYGLPRAERPSEQEKLTTEVFLISAGFKYPLCQCFVLAVVLQWAGRPGSQWIMTNEPVFFGYGEVWNMGLPYPISSSHVDYVLS